MKIIVLAILLCISNLSFSQLREGFDPDEVKALISICNSYTFLDLYSSDEKILPHGYQKVYTSQVVGLDNMFQVYKKGNIGVINFRGSTDKVISWVENMYSAMIPAQGVIRINNQPFSYSFARDTSAAVHSGYALAITLLSPHLLEQIQKLNQNGIYHIIITGFSKGGALAHMSRAYLENLPQGTLSSRNRYKTYAFANPMCGNREFAAEYQVKFSETNTSYSIINPADMIPKMPVHYQEEGSLFSSQNIQNWLYGKESFDIRQLGMNLIVRKLENSVTSYINSSNKLIQKLVSVSVASAIEMPTYNRDINYFQTGKVRELQPFPYPKILLDTAELTEREQIKMRPDADGNYYKEEPAFFQHKPYNYYVGILREYFSGDYKSLTQLYLPENI